MGENQIINPYDLNKVINFLMEDKVLVGKWNKGKGLQFTYSSVLKKEQLPEEQQKLFDSGYFSKFLTARPRQNQALENAFKHYTGIILAKFTPLLDGKDPTNTDRNIVLYTADIKKDHPHLVTVGLYFQDKKGKNTVSYIMSNRGYYKGWADDTDLSKTYTHEVGHHLGFRDTDGSILDGQLFDSQLYTIMSYDKVDTNAPTGLMLYDILALQAFYGINPYQNSESNTYVFNHRSDPQCIYDTGGIDTVSINIYHCVFDLRSGEASAESRTSMFNTTIAYGTTIENVNIVRDGMTLFLNEVDNVINFQNPHRGSIFYTTDTHIKTTINPLSKDNKITQSLSRSKKENGKNYKGWGHDVFVFKEVYQNEKKTSYQYDPQRFVFDVEDANTFEFFSSGENDLVITHKSKSIVNPDETFISSTTITNFKINQPRILILIRTKSFKQWVDVQNKYKLEINNANEAIKDGLYNISDKEELSVYHKDSTHPDPESKFAKKIASYDAKMAFIANLPENKNNPAYDNYRNIQQTYNYVPLMIKWDDIKDKKIDPQTLKTDNIKKGITYKTLGARCFIPKAKNDFYIGEIMGYKTAHRIKDHETYDVYVEQLNVDNNNDNKKVMKALTGAEIRMQQLQSQSNNYQANITIMKDNMVYQNYYIEKLSTSKKIEVSDAVMPVIYSAGGSVNLKEALGSKIVNVMDLHKNDNMTIQKDNEVLSSNKWASRKWGNLIKQNQNVHFNFKNSGSAVVRTLNYHKQNEWCVILSGLSQ